MPKELRFNPEFFDFLRELKANNKKEWFDANKDRYVADVRDPLLAFIAAFRHDVGHRQAGRACSDHHDQVRCAHVIRSPLNRVSPTGASRFSTAQSRFGHAPGIQQVL